MSSIVKLPQSMRPRPRPSSPPFVMSSFYFCLFFLSCNFAFCVVASETETNELQQLKSQINALIVQRQDDSSRLEAIERSSLNKDAEIDQLRNEIRDVRMELDSMKSTKSWSTGCSDGGCSNSNRMKNEQLTVEWLSNSISEIRAEMAEMAKSINSTATLQQRQIFSTDISILQNDVVSLRHNVEYLKADAAKCNAKLVAFAQDVDVLKQSTSSVAAKVVDFTQQIRVFSTYDWSRVMKPPPKGRKHSAVFKKMVVLNENPLKMRVFTSTRRLAYPRRRHHRPRSRRRDVTKMMALENEGRIDADADNDETLDPNRRNSTDDAVSVSARRRENTAEDEAGSAEFGSVVDSVAKLKKRVDKLEMVAETPTSRSKAQDKLRSSMLELLESVESIEAKFDNVTPVLKKEISKMEFALAQIVANLSVARQRQEDDRLSATTMAENLSKTQSKLARYEYQMSVIEEKLRNVSTSFNSCSNLIQQNLAAVAEIACSSTLGSRFDTNLVADLDGVVAKDGIGNATLPAPVSQLLFLRNQYADFLRRLPKDCDQVDGGSGLYLISVDFSTPILVFCEKKSVDSDIDTSAAAAVAATTSVATNDKVTTNSSNRSSFAYIVVQRRTNGQMDFNRNWEEYARGFGNLRDEFWLGNELIHRLSKNNDSALRIELEDVTGRRWYAEYDTFSVGSRQRGYELYVDGFSGNATNAFQFHNRMRFSTKDADHDTSDTNCAADYECGWWYSHCQRTNLNAKYNLGLTWFDSARNEWIAVSSTKMMLTKRKGKSRHS